MSYVGRLYRATSEDGQSHSYDPRLKMKISVEIFCPSLIHSLRFRAVRRRNGFGGDAPINFSRLRQRGEAWATKRIFFKDSRKNLVLFSKFSYDLFSHRKLQQNNYAATMASAARRQIIGGSGGAHKIVGCGVAARPAHGSTLIRQFSCRWRR